jgi:hypothetical protein
MRSYADNVRYRANGYGPKDIQIGTVKPGFVARHFTADGHHYVTKFTVDANFPAIAGGAALGVGLAVWDFPSGVHSLKVVGYNLALTAVDGNIAADTPELSLGDTIVSGAVATMTTTAWENILTAQVAICNGTAEVKTLVSAVAGHIVNEAAGDKNLFLNIADTWASGGETALPVTGEIWLEWTKLSDV